MHNIPQNSKLFSKNHLYYSSLKVNTCSHISFKLFVKRLDKVTNRSKSALFRIWEENQRQTSREEAPKVLFQISKFLKTWHATQWNIKMKYFFLNSTAWKTKKKAMTSLEKIFNIYIFIDKYLGEHTGGSERTSVKSKLRKKGRYCLEF